MRTATLERNFNTPLVCPADTRVSTPKIIRVVSIKGEFQPRKKKLWGEKYLEEYYGKDISEIWKDVKAGKIRLVDNEEVDWGKPVGEEIW